MKVALVHDWLFHMRGGEKVLHELAELYPDATLYTLFCDRQHLTPRLKGMKIKTSFLQFLPGIKKYYRWLLPLLPFVVKTLRVEGDVVISSSHCVAKGASLPKTAVHFCYCHTPMRYIWGFGDAYFGKYPFFIKWLMELIFYWLRRWDISVNRQVHHFIANSENVRQRIRKYYNREAEVIFPPVDLNFFQPSKEKEDYYLVVSAFVPYKRVDLVIDVFNQLPGKKLKIVGSGPLRDSLKAKCFSSGITFLDQITDAELKSTYAKARALIFPTHEDFGIVPIEAQASGTPVIALREGGALETVQHGIFFFPQTVEALLEAIREFESKSWDAEKISQSVRHFDKMHFRRQIAEYIYSLTSKATA